MLRPTPDRTTSVGLHHNKVARTRSTTDGQSPALRLLHNRVHANAANSSSTLSKHARLGVVRRESVAAAVAAAASARRHKFARRIRLRPHADGARRFPPVTMDPSVTSRTKNCNAALAPKARFSDAGGRRPAGAGRSAAGGTTCTRCSRRTASRWRSFAAAEAAASILFERKARRAGVGRIAMAPTTVVSRWFRTSSSACCGPRALTRCRQLGGSLGGGGSGQPQRPCASWPTAS